VKLAELVDDVDVVLKLLIENLQKNIEDLDVIV